MKTRRIPLIALLVSLLLLPGMYAQSQTSLPRSTPEAEGVSSEGIINYLNAVSNNKVELHSFILLRHGKVIAEGWWNPYRPEFKHALYSLSKTYTSTAVGLAVSENRLKLTDKVITFFPESLPDTISPNLAQLTVADLLTMSSGHEVDPTATIRSHMEDWTKSFLAGPLTYKPGTHFVYNSLATYMLSAIIQKVTGQKVIDYLTPRLFTPLGITGMDWEISTTNVNTGGWGLRLKTEDLAKTGQLYLQKGKWNGMQIIPAAWIEEATTAKIDQDPKATAEQRAASDWKQGYCYQIWRCRHNAFRGDGAFGQYIIVMPDQDAVLAITANVGDMQQEINLVWDNLLPAIKPKALPENKELAAKLKQKIASLALPLPAKTSIKGAITDQTYKLEANNKQLTSLRLQIKAGLCKLTLKTDTGTTYTLDFGHNSWRKGITERKGPSLIQSPTNFVGLPPFLVAGSYRWTDPQTLELTLRYLESPHVETFVCHIQHNSLNVEISNSVQNKVTTNLTGHPIK